VVGIHRAAYLARATTGRVLFATVIGTPPKVLASLFERHAPELVDRVDDHQSATRLLKQCGIRFRVDEREARLAFDDAWNAIGASSPLRAVQLTILGRRDHARHQGAGPDPLRAVGGPGAGRPQARAARRRPTGGPGPSRGLRRRGVTDWQDVVLLTRGALRERPLASYDAVIVNEAPDLSCVMVSMLLSLVGDRPDGLTLIGDGQQTIYPGGYTLGEVEIGLAGRGVALDVDHRNTGTPQRSSTSRRSWSLQTPSRTSRVWTALAVPCPRSRGAGPRRSSIALSDAPTTMPRCSLA
jgi:hypothetical protein